MPLRRVVITGLGALTPLGNTVEEYWTGLINGVSGAAEITNFDASKFKTRFACEVKNLDFSSHFDRKEIRKYDPYAQYGIMAADQGWADSGLDLDSIDRDRTGVIWASGIGGLTTFEKELGDYATGDGTPRFNPFFIPKMIADIAAGHISIKYGFRGPNFATVSACASSAHALIDAFNYIRLGKADVVPAVARLGESVEVGGVEPHQHREVEQGVADVGAVHGGRTIDPHFAVGSPVAIVLRLGNRSDNQQHQRECRRGQLGRL